LASVIESLGTEAFSRVRLGVGREERGDLVGHVLGKFDENRQNTVRATVEAAADAVMCLIENGLNESMNRFNGWCAESEHSEDRK
jgi:PTH1 family peptidyl-tRNA hydrolase